MAREVLLDRASWNLHSPEFGKLREYDDGRAVVAMEFRPIEWGLVSHWRQLSTLWLDLSPHSHVLDAMDRGDDDDVLLRYAALHWKHPKLHLAANQRAREMFASWGAQLTDAYESIADDVPDDVGRFLHPLVLIDLGHAARLAFLPLLPGEAVSTGALPPEALDTWQRRTDTTIVYVIGRVLRDLCVELDSEPAGQLNAIIRRCLDPKASARYATLGDLQEAWFGAGATLESIRSSSAFMTWDIAEEGAGWLAVGRTRRALDLFEDALEIDIHSGIANAGRFRALELLGLVSDATTGHEPTISWAKARPSGAKLETERAYSEALEVYRSVRMDGTNDAAINSAVARCYLALGAAGPAIDFAQRTLARDPKHADALAVLPRAFLLAGQYDQALSAADAWVSLLPGDAAAHYVRGRSLFSLRRFVEAREAFERACALKPQMLEAMLLRREADRAIRKLQTTVGTQPHQEFHLPDQLSDLRPLRRVSTSLRQLSREITEQRPPGSRVDRDPVRSGQTDPVRSSAAG